MASTLIVPNKCYDCEKLFITDKTTYCARFLQKNNNDGVCRCGHFDIHHDDNAIEPSSAGNIGMIIELIVYSFILDIDKLFIACDELLKQSQKLIKRLDDSDMVSQTSIVISHGSMENLSLMQFHTKISTNFIHVPFFPEKSKKYYDAEILNQFDKDNLPTEIFEWEKDKDGLLLPKNAKVNQTNYCKYFAKYLYLNSYKEAISIHNAPVLTTVVTSTEESSFKLVFKGDVDVALSFNTGAMNIKNGIVAIGEFKKDLMEGNNFAQHQNQVLFQLVASSSTSSYNPISILTDMHSNYILYWIDKKVIYKMKFAKEHSYLAFFFMRQWIRKQLSQKKIFLNTTFELDDEN